MLTNEHNPQQSLFEGHGQQSVVLPQIPQVSGVQDGSPVIHSNLSGERSHAGISSPAPALPDICRGRHQGNQFSEAANKRVHSTKNSVREEIYRLIAASAGLTSKEIAKLLNKEIHTFSGRLTKLKADNRIEETGAERDGCAVLRAKGTL